MLYVEFDFRVKGAGNRWQTKRCVVRSVSDCIKKYGLGTTHEYCIRKISPVSKKTLRNLQKERKHGSSTRQ